MWIPLLLAGGVIAWVYRKQIEAKLASVPQIKAFEQQYDPSLLPQDPSGADPNAGGGGSGGGGGGGGGGGSGGPSAPLMPTGAIVPPAGAVQAPAAIGPSWMRLTTTPAISPLTNARLAGQRVVPTLAPLAHPTLAGHRVASPSAPPPSAPPPAGGAMWQVKKS